MFSRNYEIIRREFNFKYDTIGFRVLETDKNAKTVLKLFLPLICWYTSDIFSRKVLECRSERRELADDGNASISLHWPSEVPPPTTEGHDDTVHRTRSV